MPARGWGPWRRPARGGLKGRRPEQRGGEGRGGERRGSDGRRGGEVRSGGGRRGGEGRRRTTGRAKAREATPDCFSTCSVNIASGAFRLLEKRPYLGELLAFGAFGRSFWKKQKLPKASPNWAYIFSLPFERTKRELSHLIHTTYLSSQFTYTFAKSITVLFCNEEESFSLERKEFIFWRETDSNQLFSE